MKFLTVQQLAKRLHVRPETIRAWARRGWIPSLRAGIRPILFDCEEVEIALRERAALKGGRHE